MQSQPGKTSEIISLQALTAATSKSSAENNGLGSLKDVRFTSLSSVPFVTISELHP